MIEKTWVYEAIDMLNANNVPPLKDGSLVVIGVDFSCLHTAETDCQKRAEKRMLKENPTLAGKIFFFEDDREQRNNV